MLANEPASSLYIVFQRPWRHEVAKRARDISYADSVCRKGEKERRDPLVYSVNPTVIDWLSAILFYIVYSRYRSFVCLESMRHLI